MEKDRFSQTIDDVVNSVEFFKGDEYDPGDVECFCPICGHEFDYIFEDKDGIVVGCDTCISKVSFEDILEKCADR